MSRNLLHGSVHEIYQTILNDFPKDWEDIIPVGAEVPLSFGDHGDPYHYSLIPLKRQNGIKLLFSRSGRKHRASAPSYFVHKQLLDVDIKILHTDFEKLLQIPFCSEDVFDAIATDPSQPLRPDLSWSGSPVEIHPEVLRSILHALIRRWRSGSNPVIISVPEMSPEAYNRYTFGAICTIYRCLPTALRGQIGFMTYAAAKNQLDSVGLFFLPERATNSGIYLDRETEASRQLMSGYLPECIEEMIQRIVSNPRQRDKELDFLWDRVESRIPPESIHENHYVRALGYRRLVQDRTNDPARYQQINEFLQKNTDSSDIIAAQIKTDLISGITPKLLDTYVLNLQEHDTDFRKYYTRIEAFSGICTASEELKRHTAAKLEDCFGQFLKAAKDKNSLKEWQDLLNELARNTPSIFSGHALSKCCEKWRNHAKPIYEAWLTHAYKATCSEMEKLTLQKASNPSHLKAISQTYPQDIKGAFDKLAAMLEEQLTDVPRSLGIQEQNLVRYRNLLARERKERIEYLARFYLDTAKKMLFGASNDYHIHILEESHIIREQLEALLNGLGSNSALDSALRQYDQAAEVERDRKAIRFCKAAETAWAQEKNEFFASHISLKALREQLNEIQSRLYHELTKTVYDPKDRHEAFCIQTNQEYKELKHCRSDNTLRNPPVDSLTLEHHPNGAKQAAPSIVSVSPESDKTTNPPFLLLNSRPLQDLFNLASSIKEDQITLSHRNLKTGTDSHYTYPAEELTGTLSYLLGDTPADHLLRDQDMAMLMEQLSDVKLSSKQRLLILEKLIAAHVHVKIVDSYVQNHIAYRWSSFFRKNKIQNCLDQDAAYGSVSMNWASVRTLLLGVIGGLPKSYSSSRSNGAAEQEQDQMPTADTETQSKKRITSREVLAFFSGFVSGAIIAAIILILIVFLWGSPNKQDHSLTDETKSTTAPVSDDNSGASSGQSPTPVGRTSETQTG
jgi:hypothetical protein